MIYKESPPKNKRDHDFVDEMTNLLLSTICAREVILSLVEVTECIPPSLASRDALEEAYELLSDNDVNIAQLIETLKIKIAY